MHAAPFDDDVLAKAVRDAVPDVLVGYVFGSVAAGESRPGSDLDLAVLCRRPLLPLERFDAQERIARVLGVDVDLIDLLRAPTVLRMQVITTGRVLFSDDDRQRHVFEDYTFSAYALLNEERAEILRRIEREGTVHGG